MTTQAIVVYVTCASTEQAEKLALGLVEQKLAACVNLVPAITSFYIWEGSIQREAETLMIIKTMQTKLNDLIVYVQKHHHYAVPEVIALPIIQGAQSYMEWIHQSVS